MAYKFLARQPIVDLDGKLFAYEMLYRNSEENFFPYGTDDDIATRAMISDLQTEFNFRSVTGGKRAFVNLTRQMCLSDMVLLLRPEDFVVEILESATVDDMFLQQIKLLREQGYKFALDDYTGKTQFDALLPFIDIVKVDFVRAHEEAQRRAIAQRLRGKTLLAEKLETREDLAQAKRYGYALAQGYYFSKPIILQAETIDISTATHIKLWKEINRFEPDYARIADIILRDAGMTLRLFNKAGTLQFYRGQKVDSVQHALVRMGTGELRRWVMLILLQACLTEQNDEYIRLALGRAAFMDALCTEIKLECDAGDAYLVGMFSVFDGKQSETLEQLTEQMMLSNQVVGALLNEAGALGEMLAFVRDYEKGLWGSLDFLTYQYGLKQDKVVELYRGAVEYADQAFQTVL